MTSVPLPADRPAHRRRRADVTPHRQARRLDLDHLIHPAEHHDLSVAYDRALRELAALRLQRTALRRKLEAEARLRPWQEELLKLQAHIEKHQMRMIVLFEGRDAAGKGGAVRRVTRYMNEKHYRVVALGKPTAEQCTQWYF